MTKHSRTVSGWWAAMAVSGLLAACGGGGSDTPPPTAIPDNLAINAPASADAGAAVRFGNSMGALSGLKYSWDFGDGTTSTEAAPSHSFANGGEVEVVLKVTNEVGTSREVRSKVTVTRIANVRGLVCSGADSTGWCWQNPRPTGNHVNAVFFLDANVGWRAGDGGEIFKTTDGGTTWVKQNSGISTAIQGIAFLDAQTGLATGAFGAVLRTTDGGASWKLDKLPDANSVFYDAGVVTPIDANTVYVGRPAVSGYGAVFVSTDAGASWRVPSPVPAFITKGGKLWANEGNVVKRSVDGGKSYASVLELKPSSGFNYFDSISLTARDDLRAAVLASQSRYDYTAQKYVYQYVVSTTQDGGATWLTTDGNGLANYGNSLRLLSVSEDGKTLNALANFSVLRSVDGGQNWTSPSAIDPASPYSLTPTPLGGDAFAAIGYGGVFLSEDAGQTWLKLTLPTGLESYMVTSLGLRRVDAQTLLLTDGVGNTYISKDKGSKWTTVVASNFNVYQPPAVAFRDATNGFMVDDKGNSLSTQDGGATWQVKRTDFGAVNSLQFVSKQVGWLVGSDGRLYKTTDGGENWLTGPVSQGTFYSSAKFEDDKLGWARRSNSSGYGLAATQDGGQTWTDLKLPYSVITIRMSAEAWVAGGSTGDIYVSKDKGATWKSVFSGSNAYFYAMAFSDAKTFWAVGHDGTLLRSDDAGVTWAAFKPAGVNTLRDIKFANAKVGWIVGDNGLILATVDGGKNWRAQASGTTAALSGIQIADTSTAWVTGAGGVLLATGNGGN